MSEWPRTLTRVWSQSLELQPSPLPFPGRCCVTRQGTRHLLFLAFSLEESFPWLCPDTVKINVCPYTHTNTRPYIHAFIHSYIQMSKNAYIRMYRHIYMAKCLFGRGRGQLTATSAVTTNQMVFAGHSALSLNHGEWQPSMG
jgi:hypothetical protein